MAFKHQSMAAGKWSEYSLCEQMGNIGSEVGRANRWKEKDQKLFEGAVFRAIELIDLTLSDVRWKNRLSNGKCAFKMFFGTLLVSVQSAGAAI
ncbi:MAG: hypothetical protein AABZ32_08360 [Bacteroidota bacterium]